MRQVIPKRLVCTDSRSATTGFDFDDDDDERSNHREKIGPVDASVYIVDIREYDVPYHVRVAIDKGEFRFKPIL